MFVHLGVLMVKNRGGGGMFRYSDSSDTWTPMGLDVSIAFDDANRFAADDSALYIGGTGLRKSLDGGATWMDLKAGLNSATWSPLFINGSVTRFSALALAGDTLLAGNTLDGVWRIPLDSSPPSRIEALRNGVQILRASDSGISAVFGTDILRSGDGGKTWSTKRPGYSTWEIGVLTSHNGVMHAGGRGGPLFKSLDRGVSWDQGTEPPDLNWIKSMAWNESALFAVSGQGTNDIYAS